MPNEFCPQCATPRTGSFRYCRSCKFDYDTSAAPTTPAWPSTPPPLPTTPPPVPNASASPAAPPDAPRGRSGAERIVIALIILVVIGGAGYLWTRGQVNGILENVAGQVATDIPPTGAVWFGERFSPATFAITGRLSSVGVTDTFVMVGRISQQLDAEQVVIRAYLDGELMANQTLNATGSGDVWGVNLGPVYLPGSWRYELVDIGGNVLAWGTVTAQ